MIYQPSAEMPVDRLIKEIVGNVLLVVILIVGLWFFLGTDTGRQFLHDAWEAGKRICDCPDFMKDQNGHCPIGWM
jgi:hypothetical protein